MKLRLSDRAEKDLRKLGKVSQMVVARKIRGLTDSNESRSEKLMGFSGIYRVRVGDYRIVFRKTTEQIYVILIGHRRDIYQRVKQLLD
jgi:mRNA interferase RelE/StbE